MKSRFRYFNSSLEVIRLTVMCPSSEVLRRHCQSNQPGPVVSAPSSSGFGTKQRVLLDLAK